MGFEPTARDALDRIGEDEILRRVAEGERVGDLCAEVGCVRVTFWRWTQAVPGRRERFEEAQRASGEVHAERAGEVLEELKATPDLRGPHVQLAGLKSKHYEWMAAIRDPDRFAKDRQGGSVVVNIGALHLEALKAAQNPPPRQIEEPTEEAEWEEVDGEPDPAA